MHEDKGFTACSKCLNVSPLTAENNQCESCGHNPSIAEPCMVNPSSIKTVQEVAQNIQERLPEGKWVTVWSDGIPYVHGSQLQDQLFHCTTCGDIINIKTQDKDLHQHTALSKLFGNLLFRPGPGHIEIKMARTLLPYLWDPVLQAITKRLGFRTPRAQEVVKRGVDHHRSRQILTALLEAISKELLVLYVRDSHANNTETSVQNYYQWVARVVNDNYIYMYYMAFTALLAFSLYNAAIRKNNSSLMMASRTVFTPLFHGRPHPKYQEIMLQDTCLRTMVPACRKKQTERSKAFCHLVLPHVKLGGGSAMLPMTWKNSSAGHWNSHS